VTEPALSKSRRSEPAPDINNLTYQEKLVSAILSNASDLTSTSDELHFSSADWLVQQHLGRGRANLLRALDLPSIANVLELNAKAGALTRYLGEKTASVDAVESTVDMTRMIATRTSDLLGVKIHSSAVSELPAERKYDLAIAVGVLEHITNRAEQLDLLEQVRSRLKPGAILCLAVENQWGVRNIAGVPDFTTGRLWDAIEGYPSGTKNRAFSQLSLENLLHSAGFVNNRYLSCFPDHQFARVVFDPELFTRHPLLAIELPQFPSPDYGRESARPINERALWSELVAAGRGENSANSFLVLAQNDNAQSDLRQGMWPADRLAVYFNTDDRVSELCTRTEVRKTADGSQICHEPLESKTPAIHPEKQKIFIRQWIDPVYDGPTMVELIAMQPELTEKSLMDWKNLVHTQAAKLSSALWELVPHNVVVTQDGISHPIDLEWGFIEAKPTTVIERGLLLLAENLASRGWARANVRSTVEDLAAQLGDFLEMDSSFIDDAVEREVRFQALKLCGNTTLTSVLRSHERKIRAAWQNRLKETVVTR